MRCLPMHICRMLTLKDFDKGASSSVIVKEDNVEFQALWLGFPYGFHLSFGSGKKKFKTLCLDIELGAGYNHR